MTQAAHRAPAQALDQGLAFRAIVGDTTPDNELFALIAERIRRAAAHLKLSREELYSIFSRHSIFEGQAAGPPGQPLHGFPLVETHHLIQGKVGKGALKIVYPADLLGEGSQFRPAEGGAVEVAPPEGTGRWEDAAAAEQLVLQAMREFMTGESLSMSLKCQATGAPFAGSEGLMLCAVREFDAAAGRYFLKPALRGDAAHAAADKELIEFMMNSSAELLTRAGRIAHNLIVHAAETNSTLTARLDLQLPANVVEGHLRALLTDDPHVIIGDEDMTAALREILRRPDYQPTHCALARAAATMQMEHSILLPASRERLRRLLAELPHDGSPSAAQYRALTDLFFGTGEIQQNEDQLFHHREPILRAMGIALTTRRLADCGEPQVLAFYLKTLLDNQRIMMEAAILKRLPQGKALAVDWFERAPLLSAQTQAALAALMPEAGISRDEVRRRFEKIAQLLAEARAQTPKRTRDPYWQARSNVLDLAIGALTAISDVIPSVDRVWFFTLPFTFECVTPKLGVVTRKPVALCGSALRPEAMAVGAVMAIEIFLRKLTKNPHPLKGMTVAIEGLGNAGKNVARLMLEKGVTIVGVSDSKGAVLSPGGFSAAEVEAILAHKSAGQRLNTFATGTGRPSFTLYPDPSLLRKMKADILVLTAVPGAIHAKNAADLQVSLVCELTGAAVTGEAKDILQARHIQVIPDNLASSGGLLVSLSEMLQNSAGQNWDRALEEHNLYEQLSRSFDYVLDAARQYGVDTPTASDILALQRMHALARYRERLEELSCQLAARIQAIGPGEHVLVVTDDDEDGVAAAAIMQGLIASQNPAAAGRILYVNESLRSPALPAMVQEWRAKGLVLKHVFVLDRSFPAAEHKQQALIQLASDCVITLVNNHTLPPAPLRDPAVPREGGPCRPEDLDILLIIPQTLQATVPARQFPTAMILKEIAHQLITDPKALARIDWQAALGSHLDCPPELSGEWLLFYSQFNPDKMAEAAHAIRMVTRTGGFLSAINALVGVVHPDRLETNESWEQFMAEYRSLEERVQVLVEKIVLENRRRPFTTHFFSHDEVRSPTPITGNALNELDFYHWISEQLTRRGNLAEKPIIMGQVVQDFAGRRCLGVRIRSPRGVELMEAGLPDCFTTGGLPNTAVARIPLDAATPPEQQFYQLVDQIWMKTTHPIYFGAYASAESSPLGMRPG